MLSEEEYYEHALMRCDDGAWASIYNKWMEEKSRHSDQPSGPIKTGDRKIDELEEMFFKKYAVKEK